MMHSRRAWYLTFSLICTLIISVGCATYYQDNLEFHKMVRDGNIRQALELLKEDPDEATGKNKLLYFFNKGILEWMVADYKQSIADLEQADRIIEDYRSNTALSALALLVNPNVAPYKAEDFESVLIHYYKALCFLELGDLDAAIVECRKINIKLRDFNDRYEDKNRYNQDAFALTLMGLIYDAQKDYNNAFIAYRNAFEAYETQYTPLFNVVAPEQLKADIIRTARLTGFHEEARRYEERFGMQYKPADSTQGDLVFFWNTGFGPIKSEWSVNFTIISGEHGNVTFVNDNYGLSFPFYVGESSDDKTALEKIEIVRVAFPKYTERKPVFTQGHIKAGDSVYNLELAEDINAIAFKSLEDRMLREFGEGLLRLAIKKASEFGLKKKSKTAGSILGFINALTEKADTRNWQTLPYAIHYTRVPLTKGSNSIDFVADAYNGASEEFTFDVDIRPGRTTFLAFQTLATRPVNDRR